MLEPLDGGREYHAVAHLEELEPPRVGYAFGVDDVFVAAEVFDG